MMVKESVAQRITGEKCKVFARSWKVGTIWVNRLCRNCVICLRITGLFVLLNVLYDNELMLTEWLIVWNKADTMLTLLPYCEVAGIIALPETVLTPEITFLLSSYTCFLKEHHLNWKNWSAFWYSKIKDTI